MRTGDLVFVKGHVVRFDDHTYPLVRWTIVIPSAICGIATTSGNWRTFWWCWLAVVVDIALEDLAAHVKQLTEHAK